MIYCATCENFLILTPSSEALDSEATGTKVAENGTTAAAEATGPGPDAMGGTGGITPAPPAG